MILPATHDTGSAFLAVPAKDDKSVYISSGTWSLLGVELSRPNLTEASMAHNFTNEGGAWYRFRYLKNIMGLWMIQSVRRELNHVKYIKNGDENVEETTKKYSFDELVNLAKESSGFTSRVDVDHHSFLSPDSMIEAVREYCEETKQPVPQSVGEVMQCIYVSLAEKYAEVIKLLEGLTGKKYTTVNIVGGGCKDTYLNELTSQKTGLPVVAGPVEGTAIGNLIVQLIAGGDFKNLEEARASLTMF